MNHYDIYSDLGVDRSESSADIVNKIDQRLATTQPDDRVNLDKLRTARELFADDSRRASYDKALDDPNSSEIGIREFRQFASGNSPQQAQTAFATNTGAGGPRPQQSPTPATNQQPTNNAPGASTGISIDLRTLAAAPGRTRDESLMWLIGWGIIFLVWTFNLLNLLFGGGESSSSDLFAEAESAMNDGLRSVAVVVFTLFFLILLQFVWNLRVYVGRRIGL